MVVSIGAIGSASGAAEYYAADNYYLGDDAEEQLSEWGGDAASRLGLSGPVEPEQFEELLKGYLPGGGVVSNNAGDHRPGLDLTFSAPKSVSLLALVGKDERIAPAHLAAVKSTLGWVEQRLAEARVSGDGPRAVQTGNLAYALFQHDVSRKQDPQLHVHAVILNATQRPDGQWRAVHNDKLYSENTLIGAVYHAELRSLMQKLGYQTEITGKHGSFEVRGIDRDVLAEWSTRRTDILAKASELDIKTPQGMRAVAERTRDAKETIEPSQVAAHWQQQALESGLDLSPLIVAAREAIRPRGFIEQVKAWGQALVDKVTHYFGPKPEPLMAGAELTTRAAPLAAAYAVTAGVRHLAEREATFEPFGLLRAALNIAEHGATVREVEARIDRLVETRVLLTGAIKGRELMTTRDIFKTETEMVARVQAGFDATSPPLNAQVAQAGLVNASEAAGINLSMEQSSAALSILSGTNSIQLIQGDAGAGKSTIFAVVRDVANSNGIDVVAATPQNKLAGQLRDTTGMDVRSVEGLLSKYVGATGKPTSTGIDNARAELGGKILIVDEASMVSHRQMVGLLQLAERSGLAKLVLVGDIKQINPVEAGRPFALFQRQQAPTEYLSENRRQQNPELRAAVSALKVGDVRGALDHLGERVKESRDPAKAAAQQWLKLSGAERDQTALLTSGHKLRKELLDHVRAGLIAEGKLVASGLTLQTFENLNMTTQQLKQLSSYAPGQLLEVYRHQSSIDLVPGHYEVRGIDPDSRQVEVTRDGTRQRFDPAHLSSNARGLALKVPSEIEVREGDRLIWTTNDKANGITNGSAVDVLKLGENGLTVGNDKGEWSMQAGDPMSQSLAHGRVLNMHRVQGMTYDRTISVIDSNDRLLNSKSLFYVMNSRAREDSALHLDSKDTVARSIESHRGATPNAMDISPELKLGGDTSPSRQSGIDRLLGASLERAAIKISRLVKDSNQVVSRDSGIKTPELKIPVSSPAKTYDFDMDM
ncbi:MAG: conjugative relaxase [Sphingorhabdus sp.]|uniref:MobF family relaxase n=1 Tax=Sphingorhabdus sp. TaxID=1902408 RepID=UPI0025CFB801|nr:MobF family relaxase [Sphingorhabdus sp.]MCO4092961.1 conjugative relaxase [Sphingorhabdus sp.]